MMNDFYRINMHNYHIFPCYSIYQPLYYKKRDKS